MIIEETYGLTSFNGFFEIPIYRLTNEKFEVELSSYITKEIPYSKEDMEKWNPGKGKSMYDQVWSDIKDLSEYNWKFNEIIGWITLHLNHNTVIGEIFLKKAKRIVKNSRSKIKFYDCAFKIPFNNQDSNQKIFEEMLNEINKVQQMTKFKNRYIDKSKFELIGPHIDWKNLYKMLNK